MVANQNDMFFQDPPSGEHVVDYILIPEGATVVRTELELAGASFIGNLNQESFGTTVSVAGSGGATNTFIVDFHALRTILGVSARVSNRAVTTVYMWFGTNFLNESPEHSIEPNLLNNNPLAQSGIKYFDEVITTKLKVQLNGSLSLEDFKKGFKVLGRSFPLNLRARLGDEDPFWASPGEFTRRVTLPAFDEALNRLHAQSTNGGIPLILLSDAPGNVRVYTKTISYHLEKVQINSNDITKLVLEANKGGTINISSPIIGQRDSQISLNRLGFELEGLIFSNIGVKVSPTFSVAIKVEPLKDLHVHGFKILLGKDLSPDLELFAEIQPDREGRPLAEEVLVSSAIQVDHNVVDRDFWLEVNFEESIELRAEKTYWTVLKSKNGTAEWKAYLQITPEQAGKFKFTKNAGQTWQDHRVTGFFMLISDPAFIDTQQLLEFEFEFEGVRQTIQAREIAIPFSISLGAKERSLDTEGRINSTLIVKSRQNGFIQLSKAFMDYSIFEFSDGRHL